MWHRRLFTAECASLTAGTDHANSERDTLAPRICKLEVGALTRNGELSTMIQAVGLLKGHIAEGRYGMSTAEMRACNALDKMS